MSKADRVLDYFPSFYRAWQPTKLLHEVAESLAAPVEEADTLLFRIQRAHRLNVAEHTADIIRLAAALNLDEFHFEEILNHPSLSYDQKLDLMRRRVRRVASLHLSGLGTPWAILESAAIFLNATIVPERPGDPLIKHLDLEGYSHRAVLEFSEINEKPREIIYLHESPLRRQKVEPEERWPLDSWSVVSGNTEPALVRVVIQGIGERTVRPSVFCSDTQEGVLFNGIVPGGKTLIVDAYDGATIDGVPANDWIVYFRGAITDFGGNDKSHFVIEESREFPPFDGDLERLQSSPFTTGLTTPAARSGTSQWYFKVAEAIYDGSDYDFASLGVPAEPIGACDSDFKFDESVFDFPASGIAGMAWDERVTCSFKLLLPAHIPSPAAEQGSAAAGETEPLNPVTRVASVMPRFKAAGIQALVDTARDAWILGSSRLRSADAADGEGVDFHATRLIDPRAELFVP